MTEQQIDGVYYPGGITARVALMARQNMYRLFEREMRPGPNTTILDVGVSDTESVETNLIERIYPHKANITAAGIGSAAGFEASHPDIRYVPIAPGAAMPFADKHFDVVCSNAVLEHVGGAPQRAAFIKELMRVGEALFLTIPHRWFPIEHHTATPLLHFHPSSFRAYCRASGKAYWAEPANLDFLDRRLLLSEWPDQNAPRIAWTGLWLGPWSSNLAVIWRDSSPAREGRGQGVG